MIRAGIVGCGRMGEVHTGLLRALPGVQVVGVADADRARAGSFAARMGIKLHAASLEGLLEGARPEVVHVLTPPFAHAQLACEALAAGCHVFVEKPMALTAEDARLMAAAAEQADRILTVGHNILFEQTVVEARARVATGRLGTLVGADIFHGNLPDSPAWIEKLPSGPWINDTTHLLYLAQAFLGEPTEVRAIGYGPDAKVTELRAVARHPAGLSSLTFSSTASPFRIRVTLFGTRRTLEAELITGTLVESRPLSGHRWLVKGGAVLGAASQLIRCAGVNASRVLLGRERGWSGLRTLLQGFYAAIRGEGPVPVPLEDAVRVATLLDEIRRQIEDAPREIPAGAASGVGRDLEWSALRVGPGC